MTRQARMADGTILQFPDNTPDEVIDRVAKSHAQGGAQPSQQRVRGTGIGALDQTLSSVNDFLVGLPEGVVNMAAAVTDPLLRPFVGDATVKQAQQQRKAAFDGMSRAVSSRAAPEARIGGQIASSIPLAGAAVPGRLAAMAPRAAPIVNRAIQGAIGGAAVRDSGEGPGWNPAIGAATNVLLPPVLGRAISYLGGRAPVQWASGKIASAAKPIIEAARPIAGAIDDAAEAAYDYLAPRAMPGRAMPTANPAARRATRDVAARAAAAVKPPSGVADVLGKAAQARLDNFRALGIKNPTTGMVTRDPRTWTFERETAKAAGVGDDLLSQFQEVSDGLDRAATSLVAKRGAVTDPEAVGAGVQKVLDTKRGEMQQATGALYRQVREKRGDTAAGALETFLDVMDDPDLTDNPTFDAMRTGVMRRLQRFGMAGESGMLRNGAVANISQAEELRKFVGGLGDGKDPAVRMMRGKMIDALDDDVVNTVGDDAFKAARASARARFQEFGKTFAGKMADSAIAPELVTRRILGPGVRNSDVRALKQSFFTGTPEQVERGQQAWNDLGAHALSDFFGRSRMQDGTLSAAALAKAFAKDGAKLKELLSPEEFSQMRRIVNAARDANTNVPFSAVNHSNTASAAANMFAPEAGGAPVGRKVIGNILQHAGAMLTFGPSGNIALAVGKQGVAEVAAQRSARAMMDKVRLAQNPEAAAAAMRALNAKASKDAAFRAAIQRGKDGGLYSLFQQSKPRAGR